MINPTNYSVVEGSTVLTLNSNYLQTLSVGNHIVGFEYAYTAPGQVQYSYEDSITTRLTIRAADTANNTSDSSSDATVSTRNPNTGDTTNILIWIITLLGTLAAMIVLFVKRKHQFR
ncbi:MAG: LPXTG cell wall anchor domain-containing protein [Oscillospiraceae bacterium]|nr:LPXTG cell wall anchor domain-containing protein [Oscillospiraceae bacterium]